MSSTLDEINKRNQELRAKERKELSNFVLSRNGFVKWGAIRKKYFEKIGGYWTPTSSWYNVRDIIWSILREEGILSLEMNGNFLLLGAGIVLNPSCSYFTLEKDAKCYRALLYHGALYEVTIIKCQVV